jgi:hypothetical protein
MLCVYVCVCVCVGDAVDKRGKAAQQLPPRGRRVLTAYLTTHRPHTAEALLAVAPNAVWPKVVTVATGQVSEHTHTHNP